MSDQQQQSTNNQDSNNNQDNGVAGGEDTSGNGAFDATGLFFPSHLRPATPSRDHAAEETQGDAGDVETATKTTEHDDPTTEPSPPPVVNSKTVSFQVQQQQQPQQPQEEASTADDNQKKNQNSSNGPHVSTITTASGLEPLRQRYEDNGITTTIPPPGHEKLTEWVAKPASGGGLQAFRADQVVTRFIGPADSTLVSKVRHRRKGLSHHMGGATYESVSFKLDDTPLWHAKARQLHDEYQQSKDDHSWAKSFWKYITCQWLHNHLHHGGHGRRQSDDEESKHAKEEESAMHWFRIKTTYMTRGLLILIGIVVSCVGWSVAQSSEQILEQKLDYIENRTSAWGFGFFLILNLVFGFLSFLPVAFRPIAGGSGIAEAKAVLNGVVLPQCTHLITAAAKAFSVIFSGAASLPVGLEGPLIFIGLSLGDNVQQLIPQHDYPTLRSDAMRRDFATVGTATGVTAAFLAPVGGVLFAMEEGSSFWTVLTCWRSFAANVVAAIIGFILATSVNEHHNLKEKFNVTNLAKFNGLFGQTAAHVDLSFHLYDYATFAMFGLVGGVLGACFNEANRCLAVFRQKLNMTKLQKCIEVLVLVAIMSALTFYLPQAYQECGLLANTAAEDKYFRQFGCPDGQYNHLATLLLNPPGSTGLNLIFHEPESIFSPESCVIAGFVYLIMLLFLFGTSIGMGIFIPLLYVGACFGRAFGDWANNEPQTYAIVGSVAMLAGVARVLISLTVIMMETTGLTYFATPFMVATIFARVSGRAIFGREGIYDMILQLKGIPFLEEESPHSIQARGLRAEHIMSPPPLVLLDVEVTVQQLLTCLRNHEWQDFPVIDPHRGGTLVGSVMRVDLLTILQYPILFYEATAATTTNSSTSVVSEESLQSTTMSSSQQQQRLPLALKYELLMQGHFREEPDVDDIEQALIEQEGPTVLTKSIDLSPYLQIAHNTFDRHGSAERAFQVFRTLGLRHLIVTGYQGEPVGIISRTDLALLEGIEESDETHDRNRKTLGRYTSVS